MRFLSSFIPARGRHSRIVFCLAVLWGSLLATSSLTAQIAEEWEVYSALDRSTSIATDSEGNLWVGTTGGAYQYNPVTGQTVPYRTVDALLRLDVSAVGVNPVNGDVYFGSSDGSVSILRSGGWWTYVTDIAQSSRPSKAVTGFAFNDGYTYILTTFGISEFNPSDSTIRNSWTRLGDITPNTQVNDLLLFNDSIWVATSEGLAVAPASGLNLSDPLSWNVYVQPDICNTDVFSLAVVNGRLNVGTADGACELNDGLFSKRDDLSGPIRFGTFDSHIVAASDFRLYRLEPTLRFAEVGNSPNTMEAVAAGSDGLPYGAMGLGGIAFPQGGETETYAPNGPVSNTFQALGFDRDRTLWVGTGQGGAGVSRLTESGWLNYSQNTTDGLNANSAWHLNSDEQGRVWVGTYGGGVSLFTPGDGLDVSVSHFDEKNAPFWGVFNDNTFVVATDAEDDGFGRVWIINWGNITRLGAPFLVAASGDQNGGVSFEGFSPPAVISGSNTREYSALAVDFNGTKWLGCDVSRGLLYFNDRSDEIGGDKWGEVRTSHGLLSGRQTALLVDPDGELWIGTPEGLTVLVNPGSVQQNGPSAAIFRTIRALESVLIKTIAVDALNRKWVGTDDGIVVLSSDGTEVLTTFTRANSPLVNDQIVSILPDDQTGNIYIGTANGLARVKTEAVTPQETDEIVVMPQPFQVPSAEPLRITGLPVNSTIKILTLSGAMVREYPSPGGSVAFWDGLDSDGEPVASGIYIVAAESSLGETVVGKIAVVNK